MATLPVGSIGSLIATNLAQLPSTKVRLILRRKDLASALFTSHDTNPTRASPASPLEPLLTLTMERSGLARRTSGLEVEITPSPQDKLEIGRNAMGGGAGGGGAISGTSSKFPDLVRNDPIDTLFITTKAPQTLPALHALLPRLSSASTIVLCQNGMGVLEGLLDKYWPDDTSGASGSQLELGSRGGRPSFVCATTSHGVWRKGVGHFVHAGLGDLKFGVVPNRAVQSSLAAMVDAPWGELFNNPLLNPRSLVSPTLSHLPLNPLTASLHNTLDALLRLSDLHPSWLPLPTFQLAQLQKLAVNTSVNALTAVLGVHNGALVGSQHAKKVVESVSLECSAVFAAHVAREEGRWSPPPLSPDPDRPTRSHPPPPPLPLSHPLSAPSLTDYTLRVLFHTSTNLSSTLQDILNTSPAPIGPSPSSPTRTEIDYMNGYVVALGRRYGIPTPVTDSLRSLLLLKEELLRGGAVDRVVETRSTELEPRSGHMSIFRDSRARKGEKEGERPVYARARSQEGLRRKYSDRRSREERERQAG